MPIKRKLIKSPIIAPSFKILNITISPIITPNKIYNKKNIKTKVIKYNMQFNKFEDLENDEMSLIPPFEL
jgi:hypothetical protein